MAEREEVLINSEIEQEKKNKFREQADRQRKKIVQLKEDKEAVADENVNLVSPPEPVEMEFDMAEQEIAAKAEKPKLTAETLSKVGSGKSDRKIKSSGTKSRKSQKPAWAVTDKQREEDKEKEIDELLEFAYDLDYDKYMEDFEVRQAFEVIRERVGEIKKDFDWKENIAAEWNKTVEEEAAQGN